MSSGFAYLLCGSRNCSVNTFARIEAERHLLHRQQALNQQRRTAPRASTDSAISTTTSTSRGRRPAPDARRSRACSTRLRSGARRAQRRRQRRTASRRRRPTPTGEQQHAAIERDVVGDRHRRRLQPLQPLQRPASEHEPDRRRGRRQQRRFHRQLTGHRAIGLRPAPRAARFPSVDPPRAPAAAG